MSEVLAKHEAQQRADRIRAFREELVELEHEGALRLNVAQRETLESYLQQTLADLAKRFDVDTTASQKQISWGMRIASTLGGLALCAAVVLFFLRFWGLLGLPAQVAVLVATPLVMLAATDFAARRERTLYYASLLSVVAFGAFVLNLNVLGSIFNLTPSRGALLAWGLFGLLLAFTYRLQLPLAAGLVCLASYLAACFSSWSGAHWLSFAEKPENFLLSGLILIAVPVLHLQRRYAEFDWLYSTLGLLTLFLIVLILSEWGAFSYLPMRRSTVEVIYQVSGFAGAGLTLWIGIRWRHASVVNLGAVFFALLLYLRFYHWWWDWMPGYLFFLVVGLISIGLLALFRKLRSRVSEAAKP
ncbi:MAG TPA: hypothetical protein VLX58_12395 [Bryobacteraceae bacterium]|nr:hypothetical protein [Bryobacteraceae bacterium]